MNIQKIQVSIAMRTWAILSPQEAICKEESWIMLSLLYEKYSKLSKFYRIYHLI